ncbi:MAG TPA: ATP-dependent DNA ligase [Saprospiraceae bacterium]|nr:ATP-dependent DNA ligase [Saprospiraceae bacterium]
MQRLAQLFNELDSTTATNAKVEALVRYFEDVPDTDKMWTIAMLSDRRPPRGVNYRLLGTWASEMAGLPEWLFVESYHVVGDYAETIALLIPEETSMNTSSRSLSDYMHLLLSLKTISDLEKKALITQVWQELNKQERFIFNKLITGGLRIGISQKLMMRALAQFTGQEENAIAARLMGNWDPVSTNFQTLILGAYEDDLSRPYPFYLAYALDLDPQELGDPGEWFAERKWDGIRGQLIVRSGQLFLWTRGEELVTDKYPEFHPLALLLPSGTVVDGEILAFRDGTPLPFQDMQKRIGRKNLTKKILHEIPVRMIVYDVLEWKGEDIRAQTQRDRRGLLESLVSQHYVKDILILSELVHEDTWEALNAQRLAARVYHCEGLMLKRRDALYEVGRKRGAWWKWKIDPYSVDCVMIYAQRGHGRRANMYTDFTFAVWDQDQLVPFAKAYSGLSDEELEEITRWVNQNTIERFGPVNIVPPVHVFELHFEGIGKSTRHKSGIAVRFPRIHRWRRDKLAKDADRLEDLMKMI